ncbi:MAG: hypothetical protein JNL60_01495 [Bacteroidia bacterium]|nr:hypothetical protein [Bacteroidia bacterium]
MKTRFRYLAAAIIIFSLVLFAGCKRTDANFTTDKDSYKIGETVRLTSTSKGVKAAYWILPNGSSVKGETATYLIPKGSPNTLSFSYYVRSRMGKVSEFTKDVKVVNGAPPVVETGKVVLWSTWTAGYTLYISAGSTSGDQFYDGVIVNTHALDPGCSASNALTLNMEPGTYYVWADSPYKANVWSQNITVTKGSCVSLRVTPVF